METTILLAIKEEYVKKIFSGEKRFEFRKRIPAGESAVSKIIIYQSAPISKVVGEMDISETLHGDPEELWKKTQHAAGISKKKYDQYFFGHTTAYAYAIKNAVRYETPRDLSYYGLTAAPQSFVYVPRFIFHHES